MARLPVPGSDTNVWGDVLNDFLATAHNSDGTLKNSAITGLQGRAVSTSAPADNDVLSYNSATSQWEPVAPGAASVPDATTTSKGIVQLAGDLAGTATAPTVPGLANKANASDLTTHTSATTSVHGIANTANLETTTGAQAKVDTHVNDTSAAHAASAISYAAGSGIAATDVQGAIAEARADAIDRANHTGTQAASTISDFSEAVDDRVNSLLVEGTGIDLTYDDNANTLTVATAAAATTEVTYVPATDGLTPLDPKTITQDGSQSLTLSINNGRLRGTPTLATNGNQRTLVLVNDTDWVDSEIELVLWGPSSFGPGSGANERPQMGTIHRYGEGNGKRWGFVVWWNIVFSNPNVWNLAMWGSNLDGSSFNNATGTNLDAFNWQNRAARGLSANRFNFGSYFHNYTVADASHLQYLTSSDQVDITGFLDTARAVPDVVTNSTVNITFPTNAILPRDVGRRITGTGIPAGTTIATVTSATAGTLSASATGSATIVASVSEQPGTGRNVASVVTNSTINITFPSG